MKTIINFLIPPRCLSCSELTTADGELCFKCWNKLEFIDYCSYCLNQFCVNKRGLCEECRLNTSLPFQGLFCITAYNDFIKSLILRLKNKDTTPIAYLFANWMVNYFKHPLEEIDSLIPVPLHWTRYLKRQFNQSALISLHIRKKLSKEREYYTPSLLKRVRKTPSQGYKNREERFKNIKGCFFIEEADKELIKGKKIGLIDDVVTSTATATECTMMLKKAGAKSIYVFSVARALSKVYL